MRNTRRAWKAPYRFTDSRGNARTIHEAELAHCLANVNEDKTWTVLDARKYVANRVFAASKRPGRTFHAAKAQALEALRTCARH